MSDVSNLLSFQNCATIRCTLRIIFLLSFPNKILFMYNLVQLQFLKISFQLFIRSFYLFRWNRIRGAFKKFGYPLTSDTLLLVGLLLWDSTFGHSSSKCKLNWLPLFIVKKLSVYNLLIGIFFLFQPFFLAIVLYSKKKVFF